MTISRTTGKLLALLLFACSAFHMRVCGQDTVPGIIIDHVPAAARQYIGSPSICILPNGHYIASHDFFGPASNEATHATTRIFESTDQGNTWHAIAAINQFWSGLFVHRGALYIMGVRNAEGDCIIRRSKDGGHSWTEPTGSHNGLLLPASAMVGYHTAPVPVIAAHGRIWRAMEQVKPGGPWGDFYAFMLSAGNRKDLLYAGSWTTSGKLALDKNLHKGAGWLEGNAVVAPDGNIKDLLRVHYLKKGEEKAAIINISADGKAVAFDSTSGVFDFPGGAKKFCIRYDAQTRKYWTLSNYVPAAYANDNQERVRNTLALCSSTDLVHWRVNHIILQSDNVAKHGFQYADWVFDGNDIIAVVRTAYDDATGGADNQHNANYMIFKRVAGFRQWDK
ncbi:glycosyl hydrolase [Chitinophaga parva]|uniref:Glycosyl hydrolase n=1 Tax=Chitinophaga parva TaxID=2169414 RepID=A0A2T7BIN2_9BACT|nr:sialidase family protein [Chitinophaga parva]PUZ26151.1 glycosyl hydrolase [Chitinophaga parva]